jgi:regulator of replication initiation timing
MKVLLDQVPGIDQVTTVIIENQISTIATRMKSIQAMLAQYFIMRNTEIAIEFVSSANKLKEFTQENRENKEKEKDKDKGVKQTYKQRKKLFKKTNIYHDGYPNSPPLKRMTI